MVAVYCNPTAALIVLSLFLSVGKIDFLSYYFSLLGHVLPQNFFGSFLSAQEANRGGNYKHRSMPHKILGRMSGVFPPGVSRISEDENKPIGTQQNYVFRRREMFACHVVVNYVEIRPCA